MLIRYGYDITVTCTAPTPMVCLLTAHADRAQDIRQGGLTPAILAEDERDLREAQTAGRGQLFKAADFLDVDDLLQRRHSPPKPLVLRRARQLVVRAGEPRLQGFLGPYPGS